ncbi:MAG: aldehyde dehydrogenase family protein, partial [Thermoplasmata archaeon]|nr:aldehyde dehydrogenase family protein [Thermoplasmata archaeon]
ETQLEEFARLETLNQGKTIREARGDIGFVVRTLEYASGLADKIQGETIPVPGPRFDYTLREPLGVTVHISPWNYPLVLAMRSVAPALAAGNSVVLKPASLTPLTALKLARLGKDAGIPDGIFNVVTGNGSEVGEALVTDPRCQSVTFTGSGEVGARIAELAAKRIIPYTLELGGKSPVIVFPDADLDRAARGVAFGIFGNAGQMCWAGSRLLLANSIADDFLGKLRTIAEAYRLGPGIEETAEMGPLVSKEQSERVLGFVDEARGDGAKVVTGGGKAEEEPLRAGNFVRPTVLAELPETARVLRDEVFGPVLVVQRFNTPDEAVASANRTHFGLFSALWTKDLVTAHSVARRLESGLVAINDPPNSFPQTPFGGFKGSGVGFEQGIDAVQSFTRRKNVMINLSVSKPKK